MSYGAAEFHRETGVSRETLARLEAFAALLVRWNKTINLVAPATVPDLWHRHILDSAQLWPLRPGNAKVWADLGTGGGFPGLVCAILGHEQDIIFHLIESDRRKAAFLREAARVAGIAPMIHAARIEAVAPVGADVVTARALAPLDRLAPLVARHRAPGGTVLLLKGRAAAQELTEAAAQWHGTPERFRSGTDPEASILRFASSAERDNHDD